MLVPPTTLHQVTETTAPPHQQASAVDAREKPKQQKRKAPRNADGRAVKKHDVSTTSTHTHAMPTAPQLAETRTVPADGQHMAPPTTTHTCDMYVPQLPAAQPQDVSYTTTSSQPKPKKVRKKLDFDGQGEHADRQPTTAIVGTPDPDPPAHTAHPHVPAASPHVHDTATRASHDEEMIQQHQPSPAQTSTTNSKPPAVTAPLSDSTVHSLLDPSTTAPALSGAAASVEEGEVAGELEEGLDEGSHILDRPPRSTPAQKLERRRKRKEQLRYGRVLVEHLGQCLTVVI